MLCQSVILRYYDKHSIERSKRDEEKVVMLRSSADAVALGFDMNVYRFVE